MIVTKEILEQGMSINGAWSLKQLKALGIVHKGSRKFPAKGWKDKLIGSDVHFSRIETFLTLKDAHLKKKVLAEEFDFDAISHLNSISNEIDNSKALKENKHVGTE
jgi:hypothetical protein